MPATVNGIAVESWTEHPQTDFEWQTVAGQCDNLVEPELQVANGMVAAAGAVIVESDGRIWLIAPTNAFGGYKATFPKGKLEHGMGLQATAIKETYEEAGLHIEITGFLCDVIRSTTVARYYLARRIGGNPAAMGWESQCVHLVPLSELSTLASNQNDAAIIEAIDKILPTQLANANSQSPTSDVSLLKHQRLMAKIKAAKTAIREVFPSIECEDVEYGFNTVLVYALLELASEEGKDDGWLCEAFNETMHERQQNNKQE